MYGENTKTIAIPIYKVLPYLVIKCVLAEQFIQAANYCKKSIFSLSVATVYTSAKPQTAFRGDTNYINHA